MSNTSFFFWREGWEGGGWVGAQVLLMTHKWALSNFGSAVNQDYIVINHLAMSAGYNSWNCINNGDILQWGWSSLRVWLTWRRTVLRIAIEFINTDKYDSRGWVFQPGDVSPTVMMIQVHPQHNSLQAAEKCVSFLDCQDRKHFVYFFSFL